MAGRVVDKALQILGGRGYMRESAVERLYRDVRVDRIWEGTSEVQRAIIGVRSANEGWPLMRVGQECPPVSIGRSAAAVAPVGSLWEADFGVGPITGIFAPATRASRSAS